MSKNTVCLWYDGAVEKAPRGARVMRMVQPVCGAAAGYLSGYHLLPMTLLFSR